MTTPKPLSKTLTSTQVEALKVLAKNRQPEMGEATASALLKQELVTLRGDRLLITAEGRAALARGGEKRTKDEWKYQRSECLRRSDKNVELTAKDLQSYDAIVVNTSGGKDSMASILVVSALAAKAGVQDRLIALHCDLGARIDWPGVKDYAKRQAAKRGVPLEITSTIGVPWEREGKLALPLYRTGEKRGDLLEQVRRRWLQLRATGRKDISPWPDDRNRYCTSDFKTNAAQRFYKQLAWRRGFRTTGRRMRILEVLGLKAQEGKRAKYNAYETKMINDQVKPQQGLVHLDCWLPIFCYDLQDVHRLVSKSDLPMHPAYGWGEGRLSCPFCFYPNPETWMIAAYHNPTIAKRYMDMEKLTGFPVRRGRFLSDVVAELRRRGRPPKVAAWYTGNPPGSCDDCNSYGCL